jgi:hypothetical protein
MGATAGIFFASILLKEMLYLVYIRYLWYYTTLKYSTPVPAHTGASRDAQVPPKY